MTAQAKPYRVEVFDNFDHPGERCCGLEGEFDTAEAALAAARAVVDKSLDHSRKPGQSATEWYQVYSTSGDGVYLLGEPRVEFNPYYYAKERIEQITGERPKNWGER